VVVVAIIWTKAILELSGLRLSMVSSILNSLVTVVGIAIVTHVMLHYREERREHPRIESLRRTFIILTPPVFWDVVTTMAGFGALLSSHTTPVQSFGTMMALGSLMVFFSSAFVLPGGILLGGLAADPGAAPAEDHLVGFLGSITGWVERHPVLLTGATLALTVVVGLGFQRLEVETDFSKNFRASSPVVQALNFVETRLGGSGTWEVNFPAPKELTPEYLACVRRLADRLRSIGRDGGPEVTKAVAITDLVDLMPGELEETDDVSQKLDQIRSIQPEFEPSLYNSDERRMRIILRARERQPSATKLELIRTVEQYASEEFPGAKTTGIFVLLTYIIESLLGDQVTNSIVAAASMTTIMTLAFRSFRIGLISLVPNFFPIFFVVGGMAWLGFKINIGTAMIASVSMGLTVDASIHYLAHYQRLRKTGLGFSDALRETHRGVGLALVFSTFALIIGFTVLTLSHFIPLIYFGVLVSLAMLGGLVGNLLLLPLLLHWVERGNNRKK
ncbi:MAG: RND family transporter, partial [Planctomycetaceae bacterium]